MSASRQRLLPRCAALIGALLGVQPLAQASDDDRAAAASQPASASPTANVARGRALAAACAACHGIDGNATAEAFPKLAGQHADYLAQQLAAFKAAAAPAAARGHDPAAGTTRPPASARVSPVMSAQAAPLSARDMHDLGAYYAAQPLRPAYATDAAAAARGARIWRGGIAARRVPACSGCHGAAGAGLPPQYPRLAGQWAGYLREQLAAYARGARGAATPMREIASALDERQIRDVAEFASGLR